MAWKIGLDENLGIKLVNARYSDPKCPLYCTDTTREYTVFQIGVFESFATIVMPLLCPFPLVSPVRHPAHHAPLSSTTTTTTTMPAIISPQTGPVKAHTLPNPASAPPSALS